MAKVAQKLNLRWPGKATEEVSLYDSNSGMTDGYVAIKESFTTVADIAERNNLMVNSSNIGMIVKVNSENKYYKLTSVAASNLYYTTSSSNWTAYSYTGKTYYAALSLKKTDKTSSLRVKHNGVTKYVLKEFAVVPDFGHGNPPGELNMAGGTLTRGANGWPFEGGSYCSVPDKWVANVDTIQLYEGKYKMTLTCTKCGMNGAFTSPYANPNNAAYDKSFCISNYPSYWIAYNDGGFPISVGYQQYLNSYDSESGGYGYYNYYGAPPSTADKCKYTRTETYSYYDYNEETTKTATKTITYYYYYNRNPALSAPGGGEGYRPENVRGGKGDNTPRYYDGVKTSYPSAKQIGYDYAAFAGVRFQYLDGRVKWPLVAFGEPGGQPFVYTSTYTISASEEGRCYVHILLNAIDGWNWRWNSRGAIMTNPHLKIVAIN